MLKHDLKEHAPVAVSNDTKGWSRDYYQKFAPQIETVVNILKSFIERFPLKKACLAIADKPFFLGYPRPPRRTCFIPNAKPYTRLTNQFYLKNGCINKD
jgi:hypothetical protein